MNVKELSNEELAALLRALCVTGLCPSRFEKEFLEEAATRLEGAEHEKKGVLQG